MDISLTTELLTHALEKENEAFIFSSWNGLYPLMVTGQIPFKSFDDYKKEICKPRVKATTKTPEEIMQELKRVIEQHEGR